MVEDGIGRQNRWELLGQGDSSRMSSISRVAQFAGELELKSTKLPKKSSKGFVNSIQIIIRFIIRCFTERYVVGSGN